jgi:hypothetical protein
MLSGSTPPLSSAALMTTSPTPLIALVAIVLPARSLTVRIGLVFATTMTVHFVRGVVGAVVGVRDDLDGQPLPARRHRRHVAEERELVRARHHGGGDLVAALRRSRLDVEALRPEEVLLDPLGAVAATISPREQTGLGAEEESLLLTRERADWLGAIVELVRPGPGAPARPGDFVAAVHRCREVAVAPDVAPDDALTEAGFSIVSPAWLALGVPDDRDRLAPLGAWALPRALARAWGRSSTKAERSEPLGAACAEASSKV